MHTIRLRGAWDVSTVGELTHHARRFGSPRTLDAEERLWLVCAHVPGPTEVHLNGNPAGTAPTAGPFSADVTDLLQPRNTVRFAVASEDPLGDVSLEVRRAGE